ncbi:hypothetical protein CTAYLR_010245 [Chrysophaeum taylorii]|uniref:Uncharacterized protein n=1 Tax=Chrysophaeum taylorii TaxID=2483200 RepID=A0AAD7UF42_9STRA|nr:hypothetical protein CTAYLR_010245 [Chrysophaeum taylorii]
MPTSRKRRLNAIPLSPYLSVVDASVNIELGKSHSLTDLASKFKLVPRDAYLLRWPLFYLGFSVEEHCDVLGELAYLEERHVDTLCTMLESAGMSYVGKGRVARFFRAQIPCLRRNRRRHFSPTCLRSLLNLAFFGHAGGVTRACTVNEFSHMIGVHPDDPDWWHFALRGTYQVYTAYAIGGVPGFSGALILQLRVGNNAFSETPRAVIETTLDRGLALNDSGMESSVHRGVDRSKWVSAMLGCSKELIGELVKSIASESPRSALENPGSVVGISMATLRYSRKRENIWIEFERVAALTDYEVFTSHPWLELDENGVVALKPPHVAWVIACTTRRTDFIVFKSPKVHHTKNRKEYKRVYHNDQNLALCPVLRIVHVMLTYFTPNNVTEGPLFRHYEFEEGGVKCGEPWQDEMFRRYLQRMFMAAGWDGQHPLPNHRSPRPSSYGWMCRVLKFSELELVKQHVGHASAGENLELYLRDQMTWARDKYGSVEGDPLADPKSDMRLRSCEACVNEDFTNRSEPLITWLKRRLDEESIPELWYMEV